MLAVLVNKRFMSKRGLRNLKKKGTKRRGREEVFQKKKDGHRLKFFKVVTHAYVSYGRGKSDLARVRQVGGRLNTLLT